MGISQALTCYIVVRSYLWAAAGKQPALEKAVGVGGYGYPALVAVNTKKGLYNALRGAFELDAVV